MGGGAAKEISVVIPVDGRYAYLARSLRTILDQRSLRNGLSCEIIVVDTARTEQLRQATRSICVELAEAASEGTSLVYVPTPHKKRGHANAGYARNVGIRLAASPIVLMSDADVLHVSETLAQHIEQHQKHQNLLLYSFCRDCPAAIPLEKDVLGNATNDGRYELRMASCTDWYGSLCCSTRTQCLLSIGGFDESFCRWGYEDYDLARRLRRSKSIIIRDDTIRTLHQIHPPRRRGAWLMKAYAGLLQVFRTEVANRGREWGVKNGEPELLSGHARQGESGQS